MVTLYKDVNGKIRYYKLFIYKTLFDEYLLIREYGGLQNKKPTGILKEYFQKLNDLKNVAHTIMNKKIKKGYIKKK